jgi:hypothetical protein
VRGITEISDISEAVVPDEHRSGAGRALLVPPLLRFGLSRHTIAGTSFVTYLAH